MKGQAALPIWVEGTGVNGWRMKAIASSASLTSSVMETITARGRAITAIITRSRCSSSSFISNSIVRGDRLGDLMEMRMH